MDCLWRSPWHVFVTQIWERGRKQYQNKEISNEKGREKERDREHTAKPNRTRRRRKRDATTSFSTSYVSQQRPRFFTKQQNDTNSQACFFFVLCVCGGESHATKITSICCSDDRLGWYIQDGVGCLEWKPPSVHRTLANVAKSNKSVFILSLA